MMMILALLDNWYGTQIYTSELIFPKPGLKIAFWKRLTTAWFKILCLWSRDFKYNGS